MATGIILLNAALMAGVVLTIAGGIFWAIATQHRDHDVLASGPLFRRRLWVNQRRTAFRPQALPAW